jgi:hypothetical protein
MAAKTPLEWRRWFRLSEIVNEQARKLGAVGNTPDNFDPLIRANMIEALRDAIEKGGSSGKRVDDFRGL